MHISNKIIQNSEHSHRDVIKTRFFPNCFCICINNIVCFGLNFGKNYPGCNSDFTILGHIKINNNTPVSPDKWFYEQAINHSM